MRDGESEAFAEGSVTSWVGVTRVAASPLGVRWVSLPDWSTAPPSGMPAGATSTLLSSPSHAAEQHLRQALDELAEYFSGARQVFSVAIDPRGPAFYRRVWTEVARIPFGETRSYAEVARSIGAPAATRATGAANGANPLAPLVPCHRVVGTDGQLHGYGPGLPLKLRFLLMEDALPSSTAEYSSWVDRVRTRLHGGEAYLGIRGAGIFCRADCTQPARRRHLLLRIFRTPAEAMAAGFRPCPTCRPGVSP